MWYEEALIEKGANIFLAWKNSGSRKNLEYAVFPRSYWDHPSLKQEKSIDYCFIGALNTDPKTANSRRWVRDFINKKFNNNSYLQYTDSETIKSHQSLGVFDHTLKKRGFVPKEVPLQERNFFDENYFSTMAKARFVLCPAGDEPWSMRFYESLMCRAIPIVESREHTFRSPEEAALDYRFYLHSDNHVYRIDWVSKNYNLFLNYHTLN